MKAGARPTAERLKTILFATDFSPSAGRAQAYATRLATRFTAKLVVIHAKEAPNSAFPPETWRIKDDADAFQMEELKKSILNSISGIGVEFRTEEGTAWQVVDSMVAKTGIDLIVVGTRGRTGTAKVLLGFQAEEIFRRSSCPVLTVGPHSQETGDGKNPLAEVLYATDFSPESQAAVSRAISFAVGLQARLSLLHVIEPQKAGGLVQPEEFVSSSERLLCSLIPEGARFWQCARWAARESRREPALAEPMFAGCSPSVRPRRNHGFIVADFQVSGPVVHDTHTCDVSHIILPTIRVKTSSRCTERAQRSVDRSEATARSEAQARRLGVSPRPPHQV